LFSASYETSVSASDRDLGAKEKCTYIKLTLVLHEDEVVRGGRRRERQEKRRKFSSSFSSGLVPADTERFSLSPEPES